MSATYKDAELIVESRQLEIIDAWNNHFWAEVTNVSGHCVWMLTSSIGLILMLTCLLSRYAIPNAFL
jgi:hypothetical protein